MVALALLPLRGMPGRRADGRLATRIATAPTAPLAACWPSADELCNCIRMFGLYRLARRQGSGL